MLVEGLPLAQPVGPLEDLLRVGLEAQPDAVAVTAADASMTWRELDAASSALALGYRRLGLEPGDRLASLMPNRIALVVHYLACFKAGLVAVPLNYRYMAAEMDHALEVSGAAALLAHAERAEDLQASELVRGLAHGLIAFDGDIPGAAASFDKLGRTGTGETGADRAATGLDLPAPDRPAAIFFTSGSTGPAKGVTHTYDSLRWVLASAAAGFELTADDVFMPASSMSHIGSFMWALASLAVGARVVVVRTYNASEVLPLLRREQPTVLAMLPAALLALIRDHDVHPDDFSCLRVCRSGADKVSGELLTEFATLAGFPIDEGYGMTEVGLATLNPPSGPIKQGSIGRPVGGCSISIREEDQLAGPGKIGRVWIKTRGRMVGYWNAPDATAEVISDDWLDSGDLAHADEDGYVWFFGRKKQIIVHDGSNISPLEVEAALMEHPDVALAGVVGIHDVVHGEDVRAYVTVRPGAPRPSSDELIVFCRGRVGYKAPEEVVFLDEIPLNPTGKVDRVALKHMAEEHLHPHRVG